MMSIEKAVRAAAMAAILATGACATGGGDRFGADVTRFHLGGQMARGTIFLEPASAEAAAANGLEFRQYAASVAEGLRRAGFQPVPTRAGAEFVGIVGYGQSTRAGLARRPPVSVGVGGGGGGGGFGVGGGVSFPIGKRRTGDVNVNLLTLVLRRASDKTTVWEGRAIAEARADGPYAGLGDAVPMLATALLADFPGPSATTTRYTPGR